MTYRSTLINPFVTTTSANLVEIIQNWVTTRPILKLDGLIVRVSPNCPTCIPTLGADECADEAPSNAMIARTLSVCTVRTLGQDICTR